MRQHVAFQFALAALFAAIAVRADPQKAPPGFVPGGSGSSVKPARLRDLKLSLPKGWEAEYKEALVEWIIDQFGPIHYVKVNICTILSTREPKDFAEFVRKLQTENDPFGYGYRFTAIREKGELPDGYYAIGPVKLSTDKEAKDTGFAILRKMGGQQLLFASYKINDAKQRKEAMDWCRQASFGTAAGATKKDAFDPNDIRKLEATLPQGWKEDGTIFDIRRFLKAGSTNYWVFATLYRGSAPKSAEALAELAKKNPDLFPNREWVKTTGIGKLPDGYFLVGVGKAGGFESEEIGAVRTIDGKTVLFLGAPANDTARRKELLGIIRSAKFGK